MKEPKPIKNIRKYIRKRRPESIKEVVREPTSGGVVYRHKDGKVQILLIQDAKDRQKKANHRVILQKEKSKKKQG